MIDSNFGDGDDEFASPLANIRDLAHNLILEIPRQDKHIVGLCLPDHVRMVNGDMCAGEILPLLVCVLVHGVVDEIRPNPAVVEQRVALARGAIAGDGFTLPALR